MTTSGAVTHEVEVGFGILWRVIISAGDNALPAVGRSGDGKVKTGRELTCNTAYIALGTLYTRRTRFPNVDYVVRWH